MPGARYDLETIKAICSPGPAARRDARPAGPSRRRLEGRGVRAQRRLFKASSGLEQSAGTAKECLTNDEPKGHPGYAHDVRDLVTDWRRLLKAWDAYVKIKGGRDLGRIADTLVPSFLGIFSAV